MLTRKQKDLLLFIHERMTAGDIAPSFEEMKQALNLRSKSGVHRLISSLVERGYLERLPHRARALEVKKLPEGYRPQAEDSSSAARTAREILHVQAIANSARAVPLYGKIAAGSPIDALAHEGQYLDVPPFLLGKGEHYALTVEGDSMVDAGIQSGDVVLIRRTQSVENGQIGVALVGGHEATLKRIYRQGDVIVLKSENAAYPPREVPAQDVAVQGVLTSLLRRYS